jgi:hypothetical protein
MGGALTGAAFNPSRGGPMMITGNLNEAWLNVAALIVGAIRAMVHTSLTRLAREGTATEPGRPAPTRAS